MKAQKYKRMRGTIKAIEKICKDKVWFYIPRNRNKLIYYKAEYEYKTNSYLIQVKYEDDRGYINISYLSVFKNL